MKHKEGDIVNCVCKIKVENEEEVRQGTVWLINSTKIVVLDNEGFLHSCEYHQVYE